MTPFSSSSSFRHCSQRSLTLNRNSYNNTTTTTNNNNSKSPTIISRIIKSILNSKMAVRVSATTATILLLARAEEAPC